MLVDMRAGDIRRRLEAGDIRRRLEAEVPAEQTELAEELEALRSVRPVAQLQAEAASLPLHPVALVVAEASLAQMPWLHLQGPPAKRL